MGLFSRTHYCMPQVIPCANNTNDFICLCDYMCFCVCSNFCMFTLCLNQAWGSRTHSNWIGDFNYTVHCLHWLTLRYQLTFGHGRLCFCQKNYCDITLILQIDAVQRPIHTQTRCVVSGSPSRAHPSSPPWLYTGTPSTLQRQSCQSWLCRCLGLPMVYGTPCHYSYIVGHKIQWLRTVPASPPRGCLQWQIRRIVLIGAAIGFVSDFRIRIRTLLRLSIKTFFEVWNRSKNCAIQ